MNIYLDNAATTAIDSEVLNAMMPYLYRFYGNPSSNHSIGRKAHEAIEASRKVIADILNVYPEEIFFTSGATEANNWAITSSLETYKIKHVITSPIEHKSILETYTEHFYKNKIKLSFVNLDKKGNVNLSHLGKLLAQTPRSLVSLMHVNNEIGNITNLEEVSETAKAYRAVVHSDTVQSLGKLNLNLDSNGVDFAVGSAHKIHGPKGIGLLFARKRTNLNTLLHGGGQERGYRGGTENVASIVGFAKALEIAQSNIEKNKKHHNILKERLINSLLRIGLEDFEFNGESDSFTNSLPNILNVRFPSLPYNKLLLNILDEQGIQVSSGSACLNLSKGGSHVISALYPKSDGENVRFSFSKYNSLFEIDTVARIISRVFKSDKRKIIANELVFAHA